MSTTDVIRAWKDEEYYKSLSAEEQTLIPAHPSGQIELTDGELKNVSGATVAALCTLAGCAVTINLCISIVMGGSCAVGTTGCCTY